MMAEGLTLEIRRPDAAPEMLPIEFGVYPAGAEKGNKLIIEGCDLASRHAIFILRSDGFWVEDLNSQSGTFINERPVRGRAAFYPGEEIRLGACHLIIRAPVPAASEPTPSPAEKLSVTPLPSAPAEAGAERSHPILEQKRQIKKQIHQELLERLDIKRLTASRIKETELHQRTRQVLEQIVGDVRGRLPGWIDPQGLIKEIYDEAVGLGPLEDLLADPAITEIMVNRHDQIYIEKQGKLLLSDRFFLDDNSVLAIIERIVAPIGRRIDESQPYVDARLKDGSRVNAIIPPLALNGPSLTIRKFSKAPLMVEDLIRFGSLPFKWSEFFRICVLLRKNIIISGGTGSGKTVLLNVMSSFLPDTERIITIEDAAELRMAQAHVVRLEARPPNIEGRGAVAIRDLLRNALRMRPDRIVVGECRGGEALDMLQAMNTGHDGSITTIHANSPRDVISRLETMTLMSGVELPARAIREQIASAIHLIIHTARLSDGSRKVTYVTELSGLEGDRITLQDIFMFRQTGIDAAGKVLGHFTASGGVPTFMEEIKTRGMSIDMSMFDPRQWKA